MSAPQALTRMPGYARVAHAGEIGALLVRVLRAMVTPPFDWGTNFVTEAAASLRRSAGPAMLSIAAFSVGLATVYVGGIVKALGTTDRIGGGAFLGFIREPSVWVTTMLLAGVAGSAMTADLASRKIREELDALAVLGFDQLRYLVVPRVLALTVVGPLLGLVTLFTSTVVTFVSVTFAFKGFITPAGYLESLRAFVQFQDVLAQLCKLTVCGFFVGIVSCYKGLSCGPGAEGVGRAVNEAVLISFVGVWTINIVGNTIFLSLFPNVQVLRA
jgi:phospholipid/cholesterol/gamma-HCH transport system permease protein